MSALFKNLKSVTYLSGGVVPSECRRTQAAPLAIGNAISLLLLIVALVSCSGRDRKVVLSDATGSRTLVYQYGKGFIPQARFPDDVPVLTHSMQLTMTDALKENDMFTAKALQTAAKERDFRAIERTVVEFRFRQIQQTIK
jgi:hypothetical protein